MKLSEKLKKLIEKKIKLNTEFSLVLLDVMGNRTLTKDELNRNIYCLNDNYEIVWQIKHFPKPPFDRDPFVSVNLIDGKIIAKDFSGFTYQVNIDNGELKRLSWEK